MRKKGWQAAATLEKVVNELEMFKKRFGDAHVAIGSDYGGYPYRAGVVGAQNIQGLVTLRRLLKERGWSAASIERLFYGNARRFLQGLYADVTTSAEELAT